MQFHSPQYGRQSLSRVSDRESWTGVTKSLNDFGDVLTSVEDIKEACALHRFLDALNELLGPHIFPEKEDGVDCGVNTRL